MRIVGLILSLYLILLATMPCCVDDNCPDDKTEQAKNHERGDDDCGGCSPFFNCEGCAMATIAYQPVQFEFILFNSSTVYTFFQPSALKNAVIDFWQPPKLG